MLGIFARSLSNKYLDAAYNDLGLDQSDRTVAALIWEASETQSGQVRETLLSMAFIKSFSMDDDLETAQRLLELSTTLFITAPKSAAGLKEKVAYLEAAAPRSTPGGIRQAIDLCPLERQRRQFLADVNAPPPAPKAEPVMSYKEMARMHTAPKPAAKPKREPSLPPVVQAQQNTGFDRLVGWSLGLIAAIVLLTFVAIFLSGTARAQITVNGNAFSQTYTLFLMADVYNSCGLDVSRFDAAPLIAFTATKETNYGAETDG